MTISRYIGIPLLAATSLAVSMVLLPIKPTHAEVQGSTGAVPVSANAG